MWIVGAGETMGQNGTEKGPLEERAGSVGDDIRWAMQPEVQGPPTSGLRTARGEAPMDDGTNKSERGRAATEEDHAGI